MFRLSLVTSGAVEDLQRPASINVQFTARGYTARKHGGACTRRLHRAQSVRIQHMHNAHASPTSRYGTLDTTAFPAKLSGFRYPLVHDWMECLLWDLDGKFHSPSTAAFK